MIRAILARIDGQLSAGSPEVALTALDAAILAGQVSWLEAERAARTSDRTPEGHNCGHEFTISAVSRGHYVGDTTHKDAPEPAAGDYVPTLTTKVRAHNLRDALLLAAAEPLAEWVMPDDEDEEPQP